jgi:hypothetical protein
MVPSLALVVSQVRLVYISDSTEFDCNSTSTFEANKLTAHGVWTLKSDMDGKENIQNLSGRYCKFFFIAKLHY